MLETRSKYWKLAETAINCGLAVSGCEGELVLKPPSASGAGQIVALKMGCE